MAQLPFVRRPGSSPADLGRRRSTRVEAAVRVILTGRDASGQPFREETVTTTVNLHGGRLKTRHQVLVGMQIGIENQHTGEAGKAICVRVEEPAPGEDVRFIAVQLLNPTNIWDIEDPPADWEEETGEWRERVPASTPAAKAEVVPRPATAPPAAVGSSTPAAPFDVDVRFAEHEQRLAELMESALQILRRQANEIVSTALREFQERLAVTATAGEARCNQRVEQAFAELESALKTFRADLEDELKARCEEATASAERALREKVASLVSTILVPGAGPSLGKPPTPGAKR
jgi:hypothetical protein